MMKKIHFFCLMAFVLLFFSCKSLGDVVAQGIDEQSALEINKITTLFSEYSDTQSKKIINEIIDLNNSLRKKAKNNRIFEAKVLGIDGEVAYYSNNVLLVDRIIKKIEQLNEREEWFYYLSALQSNDVIKKITILNDGILKATHNSRLKLYLADLYYTTAKYKDSIIIYDKLLADGIILPKLSLIKRDISFYLSTTEGLKNQSTAAILFHNEIDANNFITMVRNETKFFNNFTSSALTMDIVLNELHKLGYIYTANSITVTKKYISFLFNRIFNKQSITNEKSEFVGKSSIDDVTTESIFYKPILFTVEWDIIELEDGKKFMPDKTVSAFDCFKIIKNAEEKYSMFDN